MPRTCETCKKAINVEDGFKRITLQIVCASYFPVIDYPDKFYHKNCKVEL